MSKRYFDSSNSCCRYLPRDYPGVRAMSVGLVGRGNKNALVFLTFLISRSTIPNSGGLMKSSAELTNITAATIYAGGSYRKHSTTRGRTLIIELVARDAHRHAAPRMRYLREPGL
jgi:hypothetical protein